MRLKEKENFKISGLSNLRMWLTFYSIKGCERNRLMGETSSTVLDMLSLICQFYFQVNVSNSWNQMCSSREVCAVDINMLVVTVYG